ncbi:MAG: universal stress protein, partial [Chloroflexi bacterium]|nr:universal stress protein [Chloroflexota bacterium]
LQVEWETRRGDAASQIIRYVKERGIDLVAISTHGRSGLSRLVFGSVAEKVLREAGVPVLLIKPDGE